VDVFKRAYRILLPMKNWVDVRDIGSHFMKNEEFNMGDLIGLYKNTSCSDEDVGVFSNGLVWLVNKSIFRINYKDIHSSFLVNGKKSELILIKKINGDEFFLPIKGCRDKFFDSLEFIRFIDRVVGDLRKASAMY